MNALPKTKNANKHKMMIRASGVLLIALTGAAQAANVVSQPTATVIGRAPTGIPGTIVNATAPGQGLAQGDTLQASYSSFSDADGDAEVVANAIWTWQVDGVDIPGANTSSFTPNTTQNKQFITFGVSPGTDPLITDPANSAIPMISPAFSSPVLPPREQLANEVTKPARGTWPQANAACRLQGYRLPTLDELGTIFVTYTRANQIGDDSQQDLMTTYGWIYEVYYSSTTSTVNGIPTAWYRYMYSDGHSSSNPQSDVQAFVCIK